MPASGAAPPNALLIVADSPPAPFLGTCGDGCGATPDLERLAGVLFENACCSYPLCAP